MYVDVAKLLGKYAQHFQNEVRILHHKLLELVQLENNACGLANYLRSLFTRELAQGGFYAEELPDLYVFADFFPCIQGCADEYDTAGLKYVHFVAFVSGEVDDGAAVVISSYWHITSRRGKGNFLVL